MEIHRDSDGARVMDAILAFEREAERAMDTVQRFLRDPEGIRHRLEALEKMVTPCLAIGAFPLLDATRDAIASHKSDAEDPGKALLDALRWFRLAGETRAANATLFQACMLFGRAPNGKPLAASEFVPDPSPE